MQDAFLYDGKTIEISGQKIQVPEFTKFEEKCSCGDCHVAYLPEIRKFYCNDWESDILSSLMSILLVLAIFAFELWSICLNFPIFEE